MANILVVEDEKALNDAYRMILEKEGHKVTTANNGEEALKIVDDSKPDIILLDILMPKMNGLEFLQEYDVLHKHPDTQVIILSNLDMDKEVKQAMNLGASRYIVKARLSPKELALLINHLIKKTSLSKV
jgi:two-component system, OmpR family, response regulator SaeR